ncbi:hypothetical protein [Microbacterium hominis]|uniref:VIT family protein n=1 Tax=Microbacterium hominis TaxID=162426 RepID=A0A7D4PP70_9MICO|nr:hypothetical protein [Microbacterium hominis]QKJ20855.1 hypothetical protein HQM25_16795 [Microbacterium hominis]
MDVPAGQQGEQRVPIGGGRFADLPPDREREAFVAYFKERVYATFTGLAIVLVVASEGHAAGAHAFFALVLGVIGVTAAGFASDVIALLAVHREFPRRRAFSVLGRIAAGALSTLLVPAVLIALGWMEIIRLDAALRASAYVYLVTLAVIGWLAVRRARLVWWKQLVALGILVALGGTVILLQTLAHAI